MVPTGMSDVADFYPVWVSSCQTQVLGFFCDPIWNGYLASQGGRFVLRDHSIGPKRLNMIFFIMAVHLIGAPPFFMNGLRLVVSFPKQESTAPTPFDDTGPYSGCCVP